MNDKSATKIELFLRSTITDIETGEPLDDYARPDLFAVDVRRLIGVIEAVTTTLAIAREALIQAGDELSLWHESSADLVRDGYEMGATEQTMWNCYNAAKGVEATLGSMGVLQDLFSETKQSQPDEADQ